MTIIILLIIISLTIAVLFLIMFFWNVKTGQYDDTYTPSVRILFDGRPKQNIKPLTKTKSSKLDDAEPRENAPQA